MKIAISIGHGKSKSGGYDSGATGGGCHEFQLAREIGRYTGQALQEYDCAVDVINYDADKYLTDRIGIINSGGYDLAVEIHLNAGGGTGAEVYYSNGEDAEKKLAAAISKGIAKALGLRDRGAKVKMSNGVDYFGFVRSVKCRSLLVETVFIDVASDREKVMSAAGQRACASAIAGAIADFYALKPVTAAPSSSDTGGFATGDTVRIEGKYYATGQKIPAWVRLKKHTVKSVDAKLGRVLLGEINSYVWAQDLKLVSKAKRGIVPGSRVTISGGAVYGGLTAARGRAVPAEQLAPKVHTVLKIQTNMGVSEALLGGISSWVALSSLKEE